MRWIKKSLIYKPDGSIRWAVSHAQAPVVDLIDEDIIRLYFSSRDERNRSQPTFIDVEVSDPSRILRTNKRPILSLGSPGAFDDCGVMPSGIVSYQGMRYLFYTGWNTSTTVPYRLAIGIAISEDGGETYTRYSEGPVLDRSPADPFFCTIPFVMIEDGRWKMWYTSGTIWKEHQGRQEALYLIKYAESDDGVFWQTRGDISINYKHDNEAICRAYVYKQHGCYRMLYSYRYDTDFRSDSRYSYRIGYAESSDGISWKRRDEDVGIDISETGWDSQMLAYAYLAQTKKGTYMFYNGNGFGTSGLGYAVLED